MAYFENKPEAEPVRRRLKALVELYGSVLQTAFHLRKAAMWLYLAGQVERTGMAEDTLHALLKGRSVSNYTLIKLTRLMDFVVRRPSIYFDAPPPALWKAWREERHEDLIRRLRDAGVIQ